MTQDLAPVGVNRISTGENWEQTMGKWNGLDADSNSPYRGMTREQMVDVKRANRMAAVDSYPPPIRVMIHDYGLTVVKTIYDLGIRKPNQIKQIVETVLNEFSPTRGSYSVQGIRSQIDETKS